jgi:hypothetical protein
MWSHAVGTKALPYSPRPGSNGGKGVRHHFSAGSYPCPRCPAKMIVLPAKFKANDQSAIVSSGSEIAFPILLDLEYLNALDCRRSSRPYNISRSPWYRTMRNSRSIAAIMSSICALMRLPLQDSETTKRRRSVLSRWRVASPGTPPRSPPTPAPLSLC